MLEFRYATKDEKRKYKKELGHFTKSISMIADKDGYVFIIYITQSGNRWLSYYDKNTGKMEDGRHYKSKTMRALKKEANDIYRRLTK